MPYVSFLLIRQYAFKYQWIFTAGPILLCFLTNVVIMFMIIWSMFLLQRNLNKLRNQWRSSTSQPPSIRSRMSNRMSQARRSVISTISSFRSSYNSNNIPEEDGSARSSTFVSRRPMRGSILIQQQETERNLQMQAILYIAAFLLTYIFSYIHRILYQRNGSSPFVLIMLSRIFRPMQGFLNILIYTRIKVARLRSTTDYSRIKAFFIVVTSFDDRDDHDNHRRDDGGDAETGNDSEAKRGTRFKCLFRKSSDQANSQELRGVANNLPISNLEEENDNDNRRNGMDEWRHVQENIVDSTSEDGSKGTAEDMKAVESFALSLRRSANIVKIDARNFQSKESLLSESNALIVKEGSGDEYSLTGSRRESQELLDEVLSNSPGRSTESQAAPPLSHFTEATESNEVKLSR